MFGESAVILPIMFALRRQPRVLFALLFILAVMLRIGGAHAHYCFDGSEPPVTLHLSSDFGRHHSGESPSAAEHADVDVSLATEALVKKSNPNLDLPALLAVFVGLSFLLLQPRQSPIPFYSLLPIRARSLHIRPPLRGPPR